ncbi:MAG TPA: VanZ family protein [Usitatibacter sp.]|nr:VanZ family protein [Usitatibacter sp.]
MNLRLRNAWIVCGAGFILLVIYLSLTPRPLDVPSLYGMKTGHILAYAWLMFWFAQIYRRTPARFALGAAFIALGIALEYIQGLVGRDFSYTDMRDDAIGVVAGAILVFTPLGATLATIERWLGA